MTHTLTELRELEKRATQGEWSVFEPSPNVGRIRAGGRNIAQVHERNSEDVINARLIAALVTWFRSGALEELERERDALRKFYSAWKEIKQYGGRFTMDMAEAELEIEAIDAELRKDRNGESNAPPVV